jgi:hypothetical protein
MGWKAVGAVESTMTPHESDLGGWEGDGMGGAATLYLLCT